MTKKKLYTLIALVGGSLVLLNLISHQLFFRLDFTEDQRYTLSTSTLDIVSQLNEPVTVTAYFSEDLQPQFDQMRRDFKNLLAEYANRSGDKIVYKFVNPNENDQLEQEAAQKGIQPLVISSREKDQSVQKRAYLGAVVQYGEATEVLPFIEPGAQMEYALSMAIKKLSVPEKKAVGFVQGHGEPDLSEASQLVEALRVLYAPETIQLSDSSDLSKYKTLIWIRPTDTIAPSHLEKLTSYLNQGGNLIVALNKVDANFARRMGEELHTGLSDWLNKEGVRVNADFVIDANCGSINVQQQQGPFRINTPISFPYLPILSHFAEHPISKGLSAVLMPFASSLARTDSSGTFTPLAWTSKKSGTRKAPVFFNIEQKWTDRDFNEVEIPVAALMTYSDQNKGQLVVFSDGDFILNGKGENVQKLQPDNLSLLVNSVDFLSDDTGLLELRTKNLKLHPLDQVEESTRTWVKAINFGLPLLLVFLIGIVRYQRSTKIRIKRKQENYD